MTYLLLAADPVEKTWSIIVQSEKADDVLDEIENGDPSLRIGINTDDFITFDTKPIPKTAEEKREFSKEWDRRFEEGQSGGERT